MVLLPAPLWPMMPTTSPASMLKLTSSSALNGARSSTGRLLVTPCLDFDDTGIAGEHAGDVYPNPVGSKRSKA